MNILTRIWNAIRQIIRRRPSIIWIRSEGWTTDHLIHHEELDEAMAASGFIPVSLPTTKEYQTLAYEVVSGDLDSIEAIYSRFGLRVVYIWPAL